MSTEDRVKVLEGEFKLIKSEMRQTLIGVRDYLLEMKLPPAQDEMSAPSKKTASENTVTQAIPMAEPPVVTPAAENPPERSQGFEPPMSPMCAEPPASMAPMMAPMASPGFNGIEARLPRTAASPRFEIPLDIDTDVADVSSGDIPAKEPVVMKESPKKEVSHKEISDKEIDVKSEKEIINVSTEPVIDAAPQVNVLANLIQWVAVARRDIGLQQLAEFLDIYAASGNLTPEMKNVILHLADITADPMSETGSAEPTGLLNEPLEICMEINSCTGQLPEEVKTKVRRLIEIVLRQTAYSNKADNWSRLLLELHGIITRAGTALLPVSIFNTSENHDARTTAAPAEDIAPVSNEEPAEDIPEEEDTPADAEADSEEETPSPKGLKPAKLRLVLPVDANHEQELDLGSLFISTDFPSKKGNGRKVHHAVED